MTSEEIDMTDDQFLAHFEQEWEYYLGEKAFEKGAYWENANPHPKDTPLYDKWNDGWWDALETFLKETF